MESVRPVSALTVIGGGSMGSAIAIGAAGTGLWTVRMTTRTSRSAAVSASGVVVRALEDDPDANRDAVQGADVVVLAVKPVMIRDTVRDLASALSGSTAVVSVAAGVPLAALDELLPTGIDVFRAMPNTPAAIGEGVTGLAVGDGAAPGAIARVRGVFEAVGTVLEVPESQIDALSAISGSGPAYVFYFVEQFIEAARRLGFDEDEAAAMVIGTVSGAAGLLRSADRSPAALRRAVTSPNGTTAQAIGVFERHPLGPVLDEALAAAVRRAGELAAS